MNTFIFDIGKTNLKAVVVDDKGDTVWQQQTANSAKTDGDYLAIDCEFHWTWLKQQLSNAFKTVGFHRINISTHGACAALVDEAGDLVLPVMDYESPLPEQTFNSYQQYRPPFEQTRSPRLGLGLNLGAQLHWLKEQYPEAFARTANLLMYPQYFAFLLSGEACHEITSLGCHTDLWDVKDHVYSSLVEHLGLKQKCPPLRPAISPIGRIQPCLANELGLDLSIDIFPGVHDSNAGLARYFYSDLDTPFTVISTGTWIISMAVGHSIDTLKESRDMLANIDIHGVPTACARFMGGREYQRICEALPEQSTDITQQIRAMIQSGIHIGLGIEAGSGPIAQGAGKVTVLDRDGQPIESEGLPGDALATLYLARMINLELTLLGSEGAIIFGSIAQKNPWLVRLIAQLRPQQTVLASPGDASTVTGAWCLTRWQEACPSSLNQWTKIAPSTFEGLEAYATIKT